MIRPTSETIIGHAYAKWIKSLYRDLPLLINQWKQRLVLANSAPNSFVRTLEFFWQRRAHGTCPFNPRKRRITRQMLDIYTDFAVARAAIAYHPRLLIRVGTVCQGPTIVDLIEAMIGHGKALQAGTSHAGVRTLQKAFEIGYSDKTGQLQDCWTTSWGVSMMLLLAQSSWGMATTKGCVLPPRLSVDLSRDRTDLQNR